MASGRPEHVVLLGLGPSVTGYLETVKRLGSRRAYADETWGINGLGDIIQCDRVFHMDDLLVQEARAAANPDGVIAAMVEWLKGYSGEVYTSRKRPGYPGLIDYPLEEVVNWGGFAYFNSTAAYAIAMAGYLGVKKLTLFGLDYTLPNMHAGERGRACCEFWLGILAAKGVQIIIPETSSLMDACAPETELLYGYDCADVRMIDLEDGSIQMQIDDSGAVPTAEEIERRYDHTRHVNRLIDGGKA
jgi:hypothetical protein